MLTIWPDIVVSGLFCNSFKRETLRLYKLISCSATKEGSKNGFLGSVLV